MLQDLCKVGKLDTSKLFAGGDGDEEEREEKVTVGKLKLVNWEANKEESGEVKREVVKVILTLKLLKFCSPSSVFTLKGEGLITRGSAYI